MIRCRVKGDFKNTYNFIDKIRKLDFDSVIKKYAEEGVEALASATPKRTGKTAKSWGYEIVKERGKLSIYWTNDNMADGIPIAVIIEYGHGTGCGGYVQGRHYISPAIQPIFDKISEEVRKEVSKNR